MQMRRNLENQLFPGISKLLLQPPNVRNALLNTEFFSHILIRMLIDEFLLQIMKLFMGTQC